MKSLVIKISAGVLAVATTAFAVFYHGHTYGRDWEHDETHHWKKATCGHDEISSYEEHSLGNDGFCWICERPLSPTTGVDYAISENGEMAKVTRFFGGIDQTQVNIASEYEGVPVTEIGVGAFESLDTVTTVVLPSTIKNLSERAFWCCSALSKVELKGEITSIGMLAFGSCERLKEFEIPSTVTEIGEFAFANCNSLDSVTIPDGVRVINRGTFTGCVGLTSVTFGNSVTEIGESAFAHCSKLANVKLPNGVEKIGYGAFNSCIKLKTVVLPKSLTMIKEFAFSSTFELCLFYESTAEDWAKVEKLNENMPKTYFYSESEPALNEDRTGYDGDYWRYVDGVPTIWKYKNK